MSVEVELYRFTLKLQEGTSILWYKIYTTYLYLLYDTGDDGDGEVGRYQYEEKISLPHFPLDSFIPYGFVFTVFPIIDMYLH